jgi:hypothetical protein
MAASSRPICFARLSSFQLPASSRDRWCRPSAPCHSSSSRGVQDQPYHVGILQGCKRCQAFDGSSDPNRCPRNRHQFRPAGFDRPRAARPAAPAVQPLAQLAESGELLVDVAAQVLGKLIPHSRWTILGLERRLRKPLRRPIGVLVSRCVPGPCDGVTSHTSGGERTRLGAAPQIVSHNRIIDRGRHQSAARAMAHQTIEAGAPAAVTDTIA